MAVRVERKWVLLAIAVLLGGVIIWAWIDGGVAPVEPVSRPVQLPGIPA